MKKQKIYSVLFLLIPGFCAGILRGTEMAYYFDWSTAMFDRFSTDFVLPVTVILTLIVFGFLSATFSKKMKDYCTVWRTPKTGGFAYGIFSSVCLMFSGLAGLYSALLIRRPAYIFFGIFTFLTGIALLLLSTVRYCGTMPSFTRLVSSLPVFWSCFMLILTYMEHPVEPVLRVFCYDILAACFITLALFLEVAPIFELKNRKFTLFCTISAVYMIIMTLTGRISAYFISGNPQNLTDAPVRMVIFFSVGLRLFQNALCLMTEKHGRKAELSEPAADASDNV